MKQYFNIFVNRANQAKRILGKKKLATNQKTKSTFSKKPGFQGQGRKKRWTYETELLILLIYFVFDKINAYVFIHCDY